MSPNLPYQLKLTLKTVILITFLWLIIINNGQINADAFRRLQMAHAWWTGTPEVVDSTPPKSWVEIGTELQGVGGLRYVHDPGQSLLMLPADWLGTQVNQRFPAISSTLLLSPFQIRQIFVSFLIFVPLNLAAIIAAFWLLKLLDFSDNIAGLASLVLLLGTTFLHYTQIHQLNNQIFLLVTLGYAMALACIKKQKIFFACLSGLALGGVFLHK